jgi:DNA-binding NarL/FixJ family response regulator
MNKINVFLVDDHKLFREGLKLLLGNIDFIEEVYEAASGKEFLDRIKDVDCDIVLMDIEMPEINGIETTKLAMEVQPDLNIIALSMYGEEMYYYKMIDAGAKGFLLKDSSVEIVQEAIETVCDGSSYFSEELLFSILKKYEI